MNKADMIAALSEKENLSNREATEIVNTILISISDALTNGDNVEIRGFGSFSIRGYEPYTGRNPRTGEEIIVKAKKLPFFKPGKDLRNAVNNLKK